MQDSSRTVSSKCEIETPNVEVTGAARLYRAASVTAGLEHRWIPIAGLSALAVHEWWEPMRSLEVRLACL